MRKGKYRKELTNVLPKSYLHPSATCLSCDVPLEANQDHDCLGAKAIEGVEQYECGCERIGYAPHDAVAKLEGEPQVVVYKRRDEEFSS